VTDFALCVIHDNGTKELLSQDDYPLQKRLRLGPNEDMAKIFVVEAPENKEEQLSEEVWLGGGVLIRLIGILMLPIMNP